MLAAWSPTCQSSDSLPSELAPTQTRTWPLLREDKHPYTRHSPLCLPSYPPHFFLTRFLEKPFSAVPVPSEVKEQNPLSSGQLTSSHSWPHVSLEGCWRPGIGSGLLGSGGWGG